MKKPVGLTLFIAVTGFVLLLPFHLNAWAAPKAVPQVASYSLPADAEEASCRKRVLSASGPGTKKRLPFSDSEMAIIAVCQDISHQEAVVSCMIGKIREDGYYYQTPYRAWHYCEVGAARLRECIGNPVLKKHLKTTEKIYDACTAPENLDIAKLIEELSEKGDWGTSAKGDCLTDGTPRKPKSAALPELDQLLKPAEGFQGPLADEEARALQKIIPPSGMIGHCRVRLVALQDSNGGLTELRLGVQDPSTGMTKILRYGTGPGDSRAHFDKPTLSDSSRKRTAQFRDWATSDSTHHEISRNANFQINRETGLADSLNVQDLIFKNGTYVLEDKISCDP